jgi:hypothetical protein
MRPQRLMNSPQPGQRGPLLQRVLLGTNIDEDSLVPL